MRKTDRVRKRMDGREERYRENGTDGGRAVGRARRVPFGAGLAVLLLLLFALFIAAACVGSAKLGVRDALRLLAAKLPGVGRLVNTEDIAPVYETILYRVRLPRICLAGLVGMGLSATGAAFQGLFRNPLADPHILGVSSGAALGATVAMLFGAGAWFGGISLIGIAAFAGGLVTVFLVYRIACAGGRVQTVHLLLTGTAVSSFLSALISFLMTRHEDELEKIYMWTLGSFGAASWEKAGFLLVFLLAGCGVLFAFGRELNLLCAGEDTAQTLGVSLRATRVAVIVAGTFLAASCVSVSGVIGFVGLIVPHCMRLLFGPDYRKLLPCSMAAGACFMILCDTLARTVTAPTEIPVGVVTAIIGAPYFICLLARSKRGREGV